MWPVGESSQVRTSSTIAHLRASVRREELRDVIPRVAVGTALRPFRARAAPRADPSVRGYRTGLLPRVRRSKALRRSWLSLGADRLWKGRTASTRGSRTRWTLACSRRSPRTGRCRCTCFCGPGQTRTGRCPDPTSGFARYLGRGRTVLECRGRDQVRQASPVRPAAHREDARPRGPDGPCR